MNNYTILPKTHDKALLAQYYSLADAFVICSKRENFPTTCIEAQCCGTPVVGFDTGGTKETSLYGYHDFVEYGNISALSERVHDVLERDTKDLASRAHEAFSKDSMFKNYLNVYDKRGKKERILLIDVNCKGSSTGNIVYDLYSHIRKAGRTSAVCYGRGAIVNEEDIYKFGIDWETYLHAGLARITGYNGYFSGLSTRKLIGIIERFKPDLIHIHELHAYFVNIKPLIKYIKEKRIPVVWTFHCEYMYTGKCGYSVDCTNYQNKCGCCPRLKEYPKSILFDKTSQMLSMKKQLLSDLEFDIITPSQWLSDRVKTSFLKNKHVEVIHNGIDTSVFKPVDSKQLRNELKIPDDTKVILALAPNIMKDEIKGGEWVIKLADKMNNEKVYFVIVGD